MNEGRTKRDEFFNALDKQLAKLKQGLHGEEGIDFLTPTREYIKSLQALEDSEATLFVLRVFTLIVTHPEKVGMVTAFIDTMQGEEIPRKEKKDEC